MRLPGHQPVSDRVEGSGDEYPIGVMDYGFDGADVAEVDHCDRMVPLPERFLGFLPRQSVAHSEFVALVLDEKSLTHQTLEFRVLHEFIKIIVVVRFTGWARRVPFDKIEMNVRQSEEPSDDRRLAGGAGPVDDQEFARSFCLPL